MARPFGGCVLLVKKKSIVFSNFSYSFSILFLALHKKKSCKVMACHCRMNALASPAQSTSSPKSLASKEDKTHQRKLVCFPVSTTNIIRIMLEGIETEPTQIAMCCKSVCKCIWANHVQFYFASYLYERRRRDFLLPPSISLSFHSIRKETPFIPSACLSRIRCEPKNVPLLVQIGSTNSTFCIIV